MIGRIDNLQESFMPLRAKQFVQAMVERGWYWSESAHDLLVHPDDHSLCLRYDEAADRLTLSPQLSEYLKRVIVSPGAKYRFQA
jgi:hypothetical protein